MNLAINLERSMFLSPDHSVIRNNGREPTRREPAGRESFTGGLPGRFRVERRDYIALREQKE